MYKRQNKVSIISGAWNSAVTYPSTQVAERYQVPYVVPVSVADKITERGFKYTFRIAAKDSWWAEDQFKFIEEQKKLTKTELKTMAFVYENGDWGTGMAKQWDILAKKYGYQVVLNEAYPSTASDLTPVAMKVKTKKPDVILLTSNAADAILLTNTMATMKVKAKAVIGTGGGHADPSFRKNTGKNCEYMFDVGQFRTENKDDLLAQIYRMAERQHTVVKHLMTSRPWDFFMHVDMGVDRMHHGFWKFFDATHPKHEPGNPYENAIRDYYVHLDAQIGERLALLDEETAVLVVSDHGAKPMVGGICFNEWLKQEGYLVLEHQPAGIVPLEKCEVDWSRTQAWGSGGYYARLFLNVKGLSLIHI